jgi:hypothetical protein
VQAKASQIRKPEVSVQRSPPSQQLLHVPNIRSSSLSLLPIKMIVGYNSGSAHDQSYLRLPTDMSTDIHDSTSIEPSVANSTLNSGVRLEAPLEWLCIAC